MIQPHEPIPLNEHSAAHARAVFAAAPRDHEGYALYIGAKVYIPIADYNLRGQRVNGVVCVVVAGLGHDIVYFQHNGFGTANRVRPGDCYFDPDKAFTRFLHNSKLQSVSVSTEQLLKAYQPPEPGQISTVEAVA
tara:strand:- start:406436 stop:406840 length:405 start_codon:yes stop_codon:yes gene_type:complete